MSYAAYGRAGGMRILGSQAPVRAISRAKYVAPQVSRELPMCDVALINRVIRITGRNVITPPTCARIVFEHGGLILAKKIESRDKIAIHGQDRFRAIGRGGMVVSFDFPQCSPPIVRAIGRAGEDLTLEDLANIITGAWFESYAMIGKDPIDIKIRELSREITSNSREIWHLVY